MEFKLHSLGWYGFQRLCATILREILGQDVNSFLDSRDAGRDGAWQGVWRPVAGAAGGYDGMVTVQCKFTNKPNANLSLAMVQPELKKAEKLAKSGRADTYILMTNARISGETDEKIHDAFREVGVAHFVAFGYSWLCDQIRDSKRLRMLVPRVYGLGDLGQILDERAYGQATALLASLRDDLSKVVLTKTYDDAALAMEKHGFVLLLGEPASGKTTTAAMLSMAAIDQWGCSVVKVDRPAQILDHWNPLEPTQFFWVDDAFGVTQHEQEHTLGWNRVLPQVNAAIRGGARIVMTSRDYIYASARHLLKASAFPLMQESQVVIDVHDLGLDERRQILYNHLKLGTQPRGFRKQIKPFLETVAQHPNFLPEIARRLGEPLFTGELQLTSQAVEEFTARPLDFLQDVLRGLDSESFAALAVIYIGGGQCESPIHLSDKQTAALARIGGTFAGVTTAMSNLQGSLVARINVDGTAMWTFKHPTVGDAIARLVAASPELVDIYLAGADVDRLVGEVLCGGPRIRGAVLEVPRSRYDDVIERLLKWRAGGRWRTQYALDTFLATRCGTEFLRRYIESDPKLLPRVASPGLMLTAVGEVRLTFRLQEMELLPEAVRTDFVRCVTDYAVRLEDLSAVTWGELHDFLTLQEQQILVDRIRAELLPDVTARVRDAVEPYSEPDEADSVQARTEWSGDISEGLAAVKRLFQGDDWATQCVQEGAAELASWIDRAEHAFDRQLPVRERLVAAPSTGLNPKSLRSIFDDIDR